VENVETLPSACDGMKSCSGLISVSCVAYTGDTNARCRTRCATNSDCVSPAICIDGACGGVLAKYYSDTTLVNLVLTEIVPSINFDWGQGSPAQGVPVDMFSARYTATIALRFSETYTFYLLVKDGARLWVNDVPVIDDWNSHAAIEDSGSIVLQADQPTSIRVEYFNGSGDAVIVMSWSSPSEPKAVVPTARRFPH
jgi:PA14 domain